MHADATLLAQRAAHSAQPASGDVRGKGGCTGAVDAEMSVLTTRLETITPTRLDLDDVVAVAAIVEAMIERPITSNESFRFKFAHQLGVKLVGFAKKFMA